MADQSLVAQILRGDRRAFTRFYHSHHLRLRRFVQARVKEREDVEELVQDSFLSFLDSLPLFSFRSSLETFLYTIARHEVADYYRRRYAKRALKFVPLIGEYVAQELYSSQELSEKIERAYRTIRPHYEKILRLKYEDGLSVKEIASKLKLPLKAVEARLFRARKAFQTVYLEIENNE